MIILGIDPGYERLGIAILEKKQGDKKERLIFSECFQTAKALPHPTRLKLLGQEVVKIIKEYSPEALAIETLFFSKNQKTAMQVAEARGVILYEAQCSNIKIFEYSPVEIKIATTGYGKSDKKQIINMLHKIIDINKDIKHDDEYDAIAGAVTCFAHNRKEI